jgi:hypothetical protein
MKSPTPNDDATLPTTVDESTPPDCQKNNTPTIKGDDAAVNEATPAEHPQELRPAPYAGVVIVNGSKPLEHRRRYLSTTKDATSSINENIPPEQTGARLPSTTDHSSPQDVPRAAKTEYLPTTNDATGSIIGGNPPERPVESAGMHTDLRYELTVETISMLGTISSSPTREMVFRWACRPQEFHHREIIPDELEAIEYVNKHMDIPFRLGSLKLEYSRVYLLVQACFRGNPWPGELLRVQRRFRRRKGRMVRTFDRVLRCIIDLLRKQGSGAGVLVAAEVLASIHSRIWEGAGKDLLQVKGMRTTSMKILKEAGIDTIRRFLDTPRHTIKSILPHENPSSGKQLLASAAGFPILGFKTYFDIVPNEDSLSDRHRVESTTLLTIRNKGEYQRYWHGKTGNETLVLLVIEGEAGRLLGNGWYEVRTIEKGGRVTMTLEVREAELIPITLMCDIVVGTKVQASSIGWRDFAGGHEPVSSTY